MKPNICSSSNSTGWLQSTSNFLLMLTALTCCFIMQSCNKNAVADVQPQQLQAIVQSDDAEAAAKIQATVLTWNQAATVAVTRMAPLTGSGPLPPMPESRIYAIVNIAIHDALNTIKPVYKRYALKDSVLKNASPDAAIAQAAHDAIIALLPPQKGYADSLLQVSLNKLADGKPKTAGIKLGAASAAAILAKRQNDGASSAQFKVEQGILPGQYRSTPPFDGPPFNGFMGVPGWGNITPFALSKGAQFRPAPPYKVTSAAYAKDYNEIKAFGGAVSKARTADQTQIGLFWLPNIPLMSNNLARLLLAQRHITDAWTTARLLALVQIAQADGNIACLNAKYHYFFWRPYTAVHLADTDGNPNTKGDSTWQPLAAPTPPVPDYPSNHAVEGAAAAKVLEEFFQVDQISFSMTSPNLPGVTRSFTSLQQLAMENALSRIYAGYHFRNAVMTGLTMGESIGDYVFMHVLGPE